MSLDFIKREILSGLFKATLPFIPLCSPRPLCCAGTVRLSRLTWSGYIPSILIPASDFISIFSKCRSRQSIYNSVSQGTNQTQ